MSKYFIVARVAMSLQLNLICSNSKQRYIFAVLVIVIITQSLISIYYVYGLLSYFNTFVAKTEAMSEDYRLPKAI